MLCGARMEGECGGEYTWLCMAESLHHSPEILTTLLISYTPIQNKMFVCLFVCFKAILTKAMRTCWRWGGGRTMGKCTDSYNLEQHRMVGPGGRGPTFQISPLPFPSWVTLAKLLNLSQLPIPRVIFLFAITGSSSFVKNCPSTPTGRPNITANHMTQRQLSSKTQLKLFHSS